MIQAGADRILPVFATRNDRPHLLELFFMNNRSDFIVSIFPRDDNNSAHRVGTLKCGYCVCDDWSAGNRRKQFIESHAAAIARGNNDCRQHEQKKKRPTSNVQRPISKSESGNSALGLRC
jgi:hypothetical protein